MKKLLKLGVLLVVLLVVLLIGSGIAVVVYLDSVAKAQIERGATDALGFNTTVDGVHIGLLAGSFDMDDLRVANPSGYDATYFLELAEGDTALNYASLREQMVELPHLHLDGLQMNIQKKGGSYNYEPIMENLKRFEKSDQPKDPDARKFVIRELTVRDINVSVDAGIAGSFTQVEVPIEEIAFKDVGSDSDNGVILAELTDIIMKAVFDALLKKGIDLPADLVAGLSSQLAQLEALEDVVGNLTVTVGDIQKTATDALGDVTKGLEGALKGEGGDPIKSLEGAAEDIGGTVDEIGKGLGGLLGGDKKKSDQPTEDEEAPEDE